ncbi:MAG: VTT domain-containing protein, partial [Pseudomonadota bacterium]|nr:VTT domain-containing protein [Pseudomonadota bacterium]
MVAELFQAALDWVAAHPNWVGLIVFLTAMGESLAIVGMVVPGAAMMFGFGALIALGHLDFWTAFGLSVAGAVAGDGLSFWLGRALKDRLRAVWPFSRHPKLLARGEVFFLRHGGKSVLLGRFFGPVRAVIPAVAGMLGMPGGRFLLVNVASALLWAPAYLLPGIAFAASLELASQVAWRLAVLLLTVVALLWLTVQVVRGLFRLLHPRINGWLRAFYQWSRDRPLLGPVSASLLDPGQGELRGLAALAVLLAGGALFLGLLLDASGQLPGSAGLNHSLFYFLQDLRTPWADRLMVFISEVGDKEVLFALVAVLAAWLWWQGSPPAALHLLAAAGFGVALTQFFKLLMQMPRPPGSLSGYTSHAFPSLHATLSTMVYGFIGVLVARETMPARRWLAYLGAALLFVPIGLSRIYLGVHWPTDVLAGLSLGLLWVTVLGLAYNRHPAPPLPRAGLLLVGGGALAAAVAVNVQLNFREDLDRYRVEPALEELPQAQWWQEGWRRLPAQRIDFGGRQRQPMIIQWAAAPETLRRRLARGGWQPAPPLTWQSALMWLNPHARIADLPVLPQVHDGRHDAVTVVRPGPDPASRWVLRFWPSDLRLAEGGTPVWLGSLTLQRLERRLHLLSLAATGPQPPPPGLLDDALRGL